MVLWIPIKEMQINHLCTYNCMKESNLASASWKIPTIIVGHHMFNLPKIHNYHKIYVTFHVNEQPLHTQKSSIKIYFFKSQHNFKSRTRNSYKDSDLKLHLSKKKKKKKIRIQKRNMKSDYWKMWLKSKESATQWNQIFNSEIFPLQIVLHKTPAINLI